MSIDQEYFQGPKQELNNFLHKTNSSSFYE